MALLLRILKNMKKITKKTLLSMALLSVIMLPSISLAAEGTSKNRWFKNYQMGVIIDNGSFINYWQNYLESLKNKFNKQT